MMNSHKFFSNKDCKYFPCHDAPGVDGFNCMFCYCPLYYLGDKCGGGFRFEGADKIKHCEDCHLPHLPEYYDIVVDALKENMRTHSFGGNDNEVQ